MRSCITLGIIVVSLVLWSIEGINAQILPFIYSNEGNNESWLNAEDKASIATTIKEKLSELWQGEDVLDVCVEGDENALLAYMQQNPNGIVVMNSFEAPSTIFDKDDDSFVEKWLENGGIMTWLSYYPFRMRGHSRAPKASYGNVFDVDIDIQEILAPKLETKPTDLGKRFMPSLKSCETYIPVNVAVLDQLGFRYEVYGTVGENNEYADPIMFRGPGMRGWFMYHHMDQYTDFVDWNNSVMKGGMAEQIGTVVAEFVVNRFLFFSVDPAGKLAATWGSMKRYQGR